MVLAFSLQFHLFIPAPCIYNLACFQDDAHTCYFQRVTHPVTDKTQTCLPSVRWWPHVPSGYILGLLEVCVVFCCATAIYCIIGLFDDRILSRSVEPS